MGAHRQHLHLTGRHCCQSHQTPSDDSSTRAAPLGKALPQNFCQLLVLLAQACMEVKLFLRRQASI